MYMVHTAEVIVAASGNNWIYAVELFCQELANLINLNLNPTLGLMNTLPCAIASSGPGPSYGNERPINTCQNKRNAVLSIDIVG